MNRITLFADVIVPLGVPEKFTYRIPVEMNELVAVGKRVLVQFGKTKIYTGIIYKIHELAPKERTAKYIDAVLDDAPIVNELQLKFWDWVSFYYCANPGDVMNAALPSGLKLSSTSTIQLNSEYNFEEAEHSHFTEREHLILDQLHLVPTLNFEDAAKLLNVKSAQPVINNLIKKKAIEVYEEVRDKYKPKLVSYVSLAEKYKNELELKELLDQLEKKAFRQAEALMDFLQRSKTNQEETEWIRKSDLLKRSEAAAVNTLVKKEILIEKEFETGRLLFEKGSNTVKELSDLQQNALLKIREAFQKKKTSLLYGVTGSGKTEIYIELIKETLKKEQEVLYLVPEIALTTQLITRLRAVFGEEVGVYHSRFSENERVEIWNNVLHQDKDKPRYRIILGARSAVFLPFQNLGLLIVDEEHDSSFKQHDPSPRYHARDAGLYLAGLHKANVVLGSATPSIESWVNALQEKYIKVKLPIQFAQKGGTELQICDTKIYEATEQSRASFTPPLFDAIKLALKNKEQVILFQNRRGFAPYTECKQCAHVPQCVQCDVSLIYHKQKEKLVCHYCGYTTDPPSKCSACGSPNLQLKGMGTEKIEEEAGILFPEAKIARMDLDSTRSKYAYKQLIDDFENGLTDILIGTQMVTKGLDFENVGLVGILNADSLLNFPDFRSHERAFQMIKQVRGRAGRGNKTGKVIIQTSRPDHVVIENIIENDLESFYQRIISEREQYHYPPFSRLFELDVIGKDLNEVNHLAHELMLSLKPAFGTNLLGPEFPLVSRIRNNYHKHLLIKSDKKASPAEIRNYIGNAINELHNKYKKWNFRVQIDVDPL